MQLRSADEGATVFYKVSSCSRLARPGRHGTFVKLPKQDLGLTSSYRLSSVYELWRPDSIEQLESRYRPFLDCTIDCCTE